MAMIYVVDALNEMVIGFHPLAELLPAFLHNLLTNTWQLERGTIVTLIVGFIFAVLPVLLMMTSVPFWGRFLDQTNPMFGRALFNSIQCVAFGLHTYGGLTLQLWPMLIGGAVHAVGNGGGRSTGSPDLFILQSPTASRCTIPFMSD
jgi:hypothetical protein